MSRINVENIRHPDAASDSLQLSDTGNITAPGNLSVTGTSTLTDDLNVDSGTLFVDASTNSVGIGTTSPGFPLHVRGSGSQEVAIGSTNAGGATIFLDGDANGDVSGADYAFLRHGADGDLDITNLKTGVISFNGTSSSEKARIDSSGRLLVGTSSARSNIASNGSPPLQIETALNSRDTGLSVINNSSTAWQSIIALGITRGTSVGDVTSVANGDELGLLKYVGADGTNLIEAARITGAVDGTPGTNDMPGRLVFSTTQDGDSSPTERMRISQDGGTSVFSGESTFSVRVAGTSPSLDIFTAHNNASTTTNGTIVCKIKKDGDLENLNNSYSGISDVKLKENIVDANSQWSDLKALQVRNYSFKPETGYGTHTQLGLIAQEVELVSPGLVSESPDRDEEGNDLGTTTKSVNYSVLYMKAVKALQEAMERIETLETKVSALEAN